MGIRRKDQFSDKSANLVENNQVDSRGIAMQEEYATHDKTCIEKITLDLRLKYDKI